MSFVTTALEQFVNEQHLPLLTAATMETPTINSLGFTIRTGIKYKDKFNVLGGTAPLQAGDGCSFTASGSTEFSQIELEVGKIKYNETLCSDDLDEYWMNYKRLHKATLDPVMPFASEIITDKIVKIQESNEIGLWQESSLYKGFLYHLSGCTEVTLTGATAYEDYVKKMYTSIPQKIRKNCKFYTSQAFYDAYVFELGDKYASSNFMPVNDQLGIRIPNTNTFLIPVPGIEDEKYLIGVNPTYMNIGMDQSGDYETLLAIPDAKTGNVDLVCKYVLGTAIAFPNECYYIKYTDI